MIEKNTLNDTRGGNLEIRKGLQGISQESLQKRISKTRDKFPKSYLYPLNCIYFSFHDREKHPISY
jgi:hypothetical protein